MPTREDLDVIRQSIEKKTLPKVFDGMWCSEPNIGGAKFDKDGDDYVITWVHFYQGKKSEIIESSFLGLSYDPEQEEERLLLGITIANILECQGSKLIKSVPGPNEAMLEYESYMRMADEWHHWAVVPVGFFNREHN